MARIRSNDATETYYSGKLNQLNDLWPQGARLGSVITGFLNKETSPDTEINPIFG